MDVAIIKSTWEKLRVAAKKDPKKAGVLIVLVAVMGGLWAKVILKPAAAAAKAGPSAAVLRANGAPSTAPAARSQSDKFRGGGSLRTAAWSTEKLTPVSRNLFLVKYDRYQQAGQMTAAMQSEADAEKSGLSIADLKKERKILAENLQAQAAQLKLQTTVMGPQPKALVNGNLVGEGDIVASFRIVKITNRGMVIEREGIRLDVQMK